MNSTREQTPPLSSRVTSTPRPAATVVLMRPDEGSAGVEVLMLQRSPHADAVPGMFVFPGGRVDLEDLGASATRLSPRLSAADAGSHLVDAESDTQALGFHIAALRETFEECGILLARHADGSPAVLPSSDLEAGRHEGAAGAARLAGWMERRGLFWATEDLIYFAHWITPKAVPKRFDTRFFIAEASRRMQVSVDHKEIVGFRWVAPEQAIEAHASGHMPMIDPTLHNLALLKGFSSLQAARTALSGRPVRTVLPQMKILPNGTRTLIFPWDPAYKADPEST